MVQLVDLTHTFTADMPFHPDDERPSLELKTFENDISVVRLSSSMHVGTHIDGPLHMSCHGQNISEYPLDQFYGAGVCIDAHEKKELDVDLVEGMDIQKGDVVLIVTGHDKLFGQPAYYKSYPVITKKLAEELVRLQIAIIGVDTPSPDAYPHEIHKILFKSNIFILENLTNLRQLLNVSNFMISAFPLKIATDSSLVRVVAWVTDSAPGFTDVG